MTKTTTRKKPPLVKTDPNRGIVFMCPFCDPSHEISPDKITHCGATIEVFAIQKRVKKGSPVVCMRCGKGGGTLVSAGEGYVHNYDCNPNVVILKEEHKEYDWWAKVAYEGPLWLSRIICYFKKALPQKSQGIAKDGSPVGEVHGYYWEAP